MSTKPHKPEPSATPDVVVENLRSAVHASEGELAAQVVADSALDSKLLGLLGFFAIAASILLTVPHGLHDRRGLLLAAAILGALACLAASIGGSTPKRDRCQKTSTPSTAPKSSPSTFASCSQS